MVSNHCARVNIIDAFCYSWMLTWQIQYEEMIVVCFCLLSCWTAVFDMACKHLCKSIHHVHINNVIWGTLTIWYCRYCYNSCQYILVIPLIVGVEIITQPTSKNQKTNCEGEYKQIQDVVQATSNRIYRYVIVIFLCENMLAGTMVVLIMSSHKRSLIDCHTVGRERNGNNSEVLCCN